MTRNKPLRVFLAALALALLGLAYAVFVEPRRLVVRPVTIAPPGWPAALDRLLVVVLSDIHTGSPGMSTARLEEVVARVNEARPDLVLLAGDYVIHGVVGGRFVPPDVTARVLGRIDARLGTYAVLGNHDWWQGRREVEGAFLAAGIPVLDDRARAVGDGDARFWVVGVSDLWEGPHDWRRALAQVTDDRPVVLFTHNPDLFPELPARVALTVAGHTHGGQVSLPLLGPPVVPSSFGKRYAAGHVVEDGRHLFVTPGIGTSILPVRFNVPPEVSVLSLRADGPP